MNFESLLKVNKLFSLYLISFPPPPPCKKLNKKASEDILMVPDGAPCRHTKKKERKKRLNSHFRRKVQNKDGRHVSTLSHSTMMKPRIRADLGPLASERRRCGLNGKQGSAAGAEVLPYFFCCNTTLIEPKRLGWVILGI